MDYSQVTVDILKNPKYEGAIDSVKWLTRWVDSGFGMALTIVAFLIILVAMFKNVLAAAYCAYPKFWDRVDAAHKEVESIGWLQQFKDTFLTRDVNSGSFSNALMRILPNIKAFTDFEGDTIRPKTYFIRALPQMFLCIIIGAFIYNGFYRDAAAKVVDFGSEMVSRVLLEVDPIAAFDKFTGSAGRPVFASDGSELPKQKLVNQIATNTYNQVIGEYNDISGAEAKRALADAIESKVQNWVDALESQDATYVDGISWKPILMVSITNGMVDVSKIDGQFNNDHTVAQYALQFPVSDLGFSSNINVDKPMYVRIRLNLEKQAVQSGKHGVNDLTLHVQMTKDVVVNVSKDNNLRLRLTTGPVTGDSASGGTITAQVGESNNGRQVTIQVTGSSKATGIYTLSGDGLIIDDKDGRTHHIKYIEFDGGNGSLSSQSEGKDSISWNAKDLGVVESMATDSNTPPKEKS